MIKKCFRVTKYNPKNRNEYWHYLINEWTSISDIWSTLTKQEYYRIENNYSNFIINLLGKFDYNFFYVLWIEKHFFWKELNKTKKKFIWKESKVLFKKLKKGWKYKINLKEIEKLIKMFLREIIWWILIWKQIEIKIWYDYYMYILTTDEKISKYLENIKDDVLFIEKINCDVFEIDKEIKREIWYNEDHLTNALNGN